MVGKQRWQTVVSKYFKETGRGDRQTEMRAHGVKRISWSRGINPFNMSAPFYYHATEVPSLLPHIKHIIEFFRSSAACRDVDRRWFRLKDGLVAKIQILSGGESGMDPMMPFSHNKRDPFDLQFILFRVTWKDFSGFRVLLWNVERLISLLALHDTKIVF